MIQVLNTFLAIRSACDFRPRRRLCDAAAAAAAVLIPSPLIDAIMSMNQEQDTDVTALSDDELVSELWERFGYRSGPITATTRFVYEKKLLALRKNQKITPSKRSQNGDHTERTADQEATPVRRGRKSLPLPSPSKSPVRSEYTPSLPPISDAPHTPTSTAASVSSSRRPSRRVTLAVSAAPKSARNVNRGKGLSTYSSDEDEVTAEATANDAVRNVVSRLENGAPAQQTVSSAAKSKPKSRMSTPSFPSASPRPSRSPGRTGRMSAAFQVSVPPLSGFSDSELENEDEAVSKASPSSNLLRSRKRASVRLPADDVATRSPESEKIIASGATTTTSSYNWVSCSILVLSIAFFLSVFFYYFINSAYFSEFKSVSSPVTTPPFTHSSSSSDPFDDMVSKLKAPLCSEVLMSGNKPCLSSRNDIRPALLVVQNIRQLFENKLMHHFCSPDESVDEEYSDDPEVLTLSEVRAKIAPNLMSSKALENLYSNQSPPLTDDGDDSASYRVTMIHKAVQDAVALIQLNPEFRMQAVMVKDGEVSALRVNAGNFPVTWPIACRLRMGLTNAIWTMSVVAGIILITIVIYNLFASQKQRKHQQQRLFLELLEKSLELLQSPDEPGSMPVLHIRDTLISPSERKDQNLMKVWAQVVRHIETEESRVKVDMEEIEGETFKTWKWLCSNLSGELPASCGSNLMTGTIEWQGQAFNDRDARSGGPAKHSPARTATSEDFEAPTAFLKVRNMFDEETVAIANSNGDSYWKTKIKNAIIEKCAIRSSDGRHGVCHIFVDERNAKEGLVYMKCRDQVSATAAYRALHGWWCDKRLVSVRFLKDERYFSRFPEARTARSELQQEPVVDED